MKKRALTTIVLGSLSSLIAIHPANGADTPRVSVARRLAAIRQEQAVAFARQDDVKLRPVVQDCFRAAQTGDWPTIRPAAESALKDKPWFTQTKLWIRQLLLDVYGACEQEALWQPDLLDQFAKDVLDGVPDGSIYFGGTDAGRFSITAWAAVHRPGKVFVLTQNALPDAGYLEYLGRLYPSGIWLPQTGDMTNALKAYEADVKAGLRPPASPASFEACMELMNRLSKDIFERNKATRPVFVEESIALPWMLPQAEPHGVVMKLTDGRPGTLATNVVERDRRYWDEKERRLLADDRFKGCAPARRAYSKCRSAIGGLYAARGMYGEAEYAYRQAIRLDPRFNETSYRLAMVLAGQGRSSEADAVLLELKKVGPDVWQIAQSKERCLRNGDKATAQRIEKEETDSFHRRLDDMRQQLARYAGSQKAAQKPK